MLYTHRGSILRQPTTADNGRSQERLSHAKKHNEAAEVAVGMHTGADFSDLEKEVM